MQSAGMTLPCINVCNYYKHKIMFVLSISVNHYLPQEAKELSIVSLKLASTFHCVFKSET